MKTDLDIVEEFLLNVEGNDFYKSEFSIIEKACNIAMQAHKEQYRLSGIPYIIHPIEVTLMLMERYNDVPLILGGLLHDTVEDSDDITVDLLNKEFGNQVGFVVDAVTKTTNTFSDFPEIKFKDKVEKLLFGGMKDIRCLLIKLTDRQHNLITLSRLKEHKQIRMAFETQAIYEPLKYILNFNQYCNLSDREGLLQQYLEKNRLNTALQFKKSLYSMTFQDFDDDTFLIVYNNTDRVLWQLEDKIMFEELMQNESFAEGIELLQMRTDGDSHKYLFKFTKGLLLDNIKHKFSMGYFNN